MRNKWTLSDTKDIFSVFQLGLFGPGVFFWGGGGVGFTCF